MARFFAVNWAVAVAAVLLASAALAAPPNGFMEQCKKETKRASVGLAADLKAMKRNGARGGSLKPYQERLKEINKGFLVAPVLDPSLKPGSVGRAPTQRPWELGLLIPVVKVLGSKSVVVELPLSDGTVAAVQSTDSPLVGKLKSAIYDTNGSHRKVVLNGVNADSRQTHTTDSGSWESIGLPAAMEVSSEQIDGMAVLVPFDLQTWAKSQKKK